ncbi:hypothetical protein FWK35_00021524 [Aphis craccivora]|uniref:Uncharacterized protein n=1 Tax=Aphis craccivora TaxID=307492 RepID=A0A6G0YZV2_APHCR|nr:hypothetical protein FWK35_00021524 [Aphis craccivora]
MNLDGALSRLFF